VSGARRRQSPREVKRLRNLVHSLAERLDIAVKALLGETT
jgi:hypothetical protein